MSTRLRTLAVLGDLHYETENHAEYVAAREQVVAQRPDVVFQLGDQGGYSHCGTWLSFMEGLDFLTGFERPFHSLIGNHDLESPEYRTDDDAVAAWCRAFSRPRPYYEVDLGDYLAICLSTTRFRSNIGSHQEVYLGDEQIAWFEATLAANRGRPTFVFSHVPIVGSGLRVLQNVHLMCPNAWLNHTDRPERFIEILRRNPQIKLWFSAHNHLGQSYADSVTQVGNCLFVHTGVIGPVTRDGCRHSRLVQFDASGLRLATIDHQTNTALDDLTYDYATSRAARAALRAQPAPTEHFSPPRFPTGENALVSGGSVFVRHHDMLVEFDRTLAAPLGVVVNGLGDAELVAEEDGICVVERTGARRLIRPNRDGRFLQIFNPNPWRKSPRSA